MTVAAMDAGGVEFGLDPAWHAPTGPLITNDEVAKFVAAYPTRFAGLAAVDLSRPMRAVHELRRCVKELRFKGLRVLPWLWGLPPNDRRYYPLYAECIELGVPFCTQVGHTGPLRTSETGRLIPYLDDVALDFPDLVIVAGHVAIRGRKRYRAREEIPQRLHRHVGLYRPALSTGTRALHAGRRTKESSIWHELSDDLAAQGPRRPRRSRPRRRGTRHVPLGERASGLPPRVRVARRPSRQPPSSSVVVREPLCPLTHSGCFGKRMTSGGKVAHIST